MAEPNISTVLSGIELGLLICCTNVDSPTLPVISAKLYDSAGKTVAVFPSNMSRKHPC